MSGKMLSNGTLSLRFMQNAQRAKLQAQVEAEQARIKDDAEWEVSPAVKEAWDIGSLSARSEPTVIHETSYLPFLFSADTEQIGGGSSSRTQSDQEPALRGRRTFDNRGKEVIRTMIVEDDEEDDKEEPETKPSPKKQQVWHNGQKAGISAASGAVRIPSPFGGTIKKDTKKPRTKSAQMLIRETTTVQPPQEADRLPSSSGPRFVKPAGIDEPVSRPGKAASSSKRQREPEQNSTADLSESKSLKRKKQKKVGYA